MHDEGEEMAMEAGGVEGQEEEPVVFADEKDAELVEEVQGLNQPPDEDMGEGEGGGEQEGEEEDDEPQQDDAAARFEGHEDSVYCVGCHPHHSNVVVSGGGDDLAFIWDSNTGQPIHKLEGHTDTVVAVGFSFDGKLAATGAMDSEVRVWDVDTGSQVCVLSASESVEWVQWHSKGAVLAAGDAAGSVWLWSPLKQNPIMGVFSGHAGAVSCGCFCNDGKLVCSGGEDGTVRLWSPNTGGATHVFQDAHSDAVLAMAASAVQPVVLTGSGDGTACVLNVDTNKVLGKLGGHGSAVECVALSPSLPLAVTGCLDGTIRIWDLNSMQQRSSCSHAGAVVRVKFLPHSALLVSTSADHSVRVWDSRSAQPVALLRGHADTVLDVACASDGKTIVSAGDDHTARVFVLPA